MADQVDSPTHVMTSPFGEPFLRTWEINENSTRYERLEAAPSDDTLMILWSIWVAISGAIALFVSVVLAGILCNARARQNPFNLFLVYLMIPDILFSAGCALSCWMNIIGGEYWGTGACYVQSFYLIFGFAGNSWLNMLIGREVHLLLQSSTQLKKYAMPTPRVVTEKALAAYAWAAFVASWGLWGSRVSWFPHQTIFLHGMGCFPMEYSFASTLFYFLVFLPLAAGIPIVYVLYIAWDIWRRQLMPPTGKRRLLSMYFLRIVAAYLIMWIPYLILVVSATGQPIVVFVGGSWGHLQGIVSSGISLTKPDVYNAVRKFVTCQCWSKLNDNTIRNSSRKKASSSPQRPEPKHSTSSHNYKTNSSHPEDTIAAIEPRRNSSVRRSALRSLSTVFMWPLASSDDAMAWSDSDNNGSNPLDLEDSKERNDNEDVEEGLKSNNESDEMENRPTVVPLHEENEPEPDDFLPRQQADFTYDDET